MKSRKGTQRALLTSRKYKEFHVDLFGFLSTAWSRVSAQTFKSLFSVPSSCNFPSLFFTILSLFTQSPLPLEALWSTSSVMKLMEWEEREWRKRSTPEYLISLTISIDSGSQANFVCPKSMPHWNGVKRPIDCWGTEFQPYLRKRNPSMRGAQKVNFSTTPHLGNRIDGAMGNLWVIWHWQERSRPSVSANFCSMPVLTLLNFYSLTEKRDDVRHRYRRYMCVHEQSTTHYSAHLCLKNGIFQSFLSNTHKGHLKIGCKPGELRKDAS